MALPLSPNTALAVNKLFTEADRAEAERLLVEHCADGLRGCQDENEYSLEDLRFQVLKHSGGDIGRLRRAVQAAQHDWRELMAPRGRVKRYKWQLLGGAMARNPYTDAVQNLQRWNAFAVAASFAAVLALSLQGVPPSRLALAMLVIALVHSIGTLIVRRAAAFRREGPAPLILSVLTWVGFPMLLAVLLASALRAAGGT